MIDFFKGRDIGSSCDRVWRERQSRATSPPAELPEHLSLAHTADPTAISQTIYYLYCNPSGPPPPRALLAPLHPRSKSNQHFLHYRILSHNVVKPANFGHKAARTYLRLLTISCCWYCSLASLSSWGSTSPVKGSVPKGLRNSKM